MPAEPNREPKLVTTMRAELGVGFQAINERYTSTVTCIHMDSINAVASHSNLFNTLTTTWTLRPVIHTATTYSGSISDSKGNSAENNLYSKNGYRHFVNGPKVSSADLLRLIGKLESNEYETSSEGPPIHTKTASEDASNHPECIVNFEIAYEFKSVLYAHISDLFFYQVSLKMMEAFEQRALEVYGKPRNV